MPRRSARSRAKFTVSDKRALNKVKKAISSEELHVIGVSFPVDPNTTGTVSNLSAVAQEVDSNDRLGDAIMPQMLEATGIITLHASATNSQVRMMIVRDNFGTTAIPAITDLFSSVTQFFQNRPAIGDVQSRARFTVIWDKFVILEANSYGSTIAVKMKKKLAQKQILYTGPAGTDEGQNNLYLFLASSEATNDPVVSIQTKFWYKP